MSNPKVLVTGAGGQVGQEATALFATTGWEVAGFDHHGLDVSNRTAVLDAIEGIRPDAVVNLAAWNAVDAAESDPEGALAVNGMAVRHLAEGCDPARSCGPRPAAHVPQPTSRGYASRR